MGVYRGWVYEIITERNKNFLIFIMFFTFWLLLIFGCVHLDLLLNPWVTKVAEEWQWYNYFTSTHSLTVLYIKTNYFWPVDAIISLFYAFACHQSWNWSWK